MTHAIYRQVYTECRMVVIEQHWSDRGPGAIEVGAACYGGGVGVRML